MIKIVIIAQITPNKIPTETQVPISVQFVSALLDLSMDSESTWKKSKGFTMIS